MHGRRALRASRFAFGTIALMVDRATNEYEIGFSELVEAQRAHNATTHWRITDKVVAALVFGVGVAAVVSEQYAWAAFLLISTPLILADAPRIIQLWLRTHRNPHLKLSWHATFNDAGATFQSPTSRTDVQWNGIMRSLETKNTISLIFAPGQVIVIPKRAFANPDDMAFVLAGGDGSANQPQSG